MIVVLKKSAGYKEVFKVKEIVESMGFKVHLSHRGENIIVGIIGDTRQLPQERLESLECVDKVIRILKPFKFVAREWNPEGTKIQVVNNIIGGREFTVIAGPYAVESREQMLEIAEFIKEQGASILRGNVFIPRTFSHLHQKLEIERLKYLRESGDQYNMPVMTEIMSPEQVSIVTEYVDILQIGSNNMQNFALLRAVGQSNKPVLIERGVMATIEEFLLAADYIMQEGNNKIILCECGIRTFENYTRNTLDISAIPLIKQLTHLPIVVDPLHATGKRELIAPLTRASLVAGADGVMIEVNIDFKKTLFDSKQAMNYSEFINMMKDIKRMAKILGR